MPCLPKEGYGRDYTLRLKTFDEQEDYEQSESSSSRQHDVKELRCEVVIE
jgi:hypothetical protein